MKCFNLKCTAQWIFYIFIWYFQHSRRFPCALFKSIPYPRGYHSRRLSLSLSISYVFSCTSCKWNHTLFTLLSILFCSWKCLLDLPNVVKHINNTLFFLLCGIWSYWFTIMYLVFLLMDSWSCFQFGANITKHVEAFSYKT